MFDKFKRSWALVKECWHIFKADKEMLLFPALAFLINILISILFILPSLTIPDTEFNERFNSHIGQFLFFMWLLIVYFIITLSNVAVVYCTTLRLKGQNPTLKDGLIAALKNVHKVALWSLIITLVSYILEKVRNRFPSINKLIRYSRIAISLATFFVVPVIVIEKKGVIPSIKRSAELFIKTWGETAIGKYGIGMFFAVVTALLAFIVVLFSLLLHNIFDLTIFSSDLPPIVGLILLESLLFGPMIIIVVVGIAGFAFGSLFSAMYATVLYNYAASKVLPLNFKKEMVVKAFSYTKDKRRVKRL